MPAISCLSALHLLLGRLSPKEPGFCMSSCFSSVSRHEQTEADLAVVSVSSLVVEWSAPRANQNTPMSGYLFLDLYTWEPCFHWDHGQPNHLMRITKPCTSLVISDPRFCEGWHRWTITKHKRFSPESRLIDDVGLVQMVKTSCRQLLKIEWGTKTTERSNFGGVSDLSLGGRR